MKKHTVIIQDSNNPHLKIKGETVNPTRYTKQALKDIAVAKGKKSGRLFQRWIMFKESNEVDVIVVQEKVAI